MKSELFIFIYVTLVGSIMLFTFVFLGLYFTYWINDTVVPVRVLFYTSLKIGVWGGGIGGTSTWLVHLFKYRYRK